MQKWEYMSVNIEWDDNASKWTVTGSWGKSLGTDNFGTTLSPLGEQGWEIVGFAVDETYPSRGAWEAVRYRVLLKRPKQ